MTGPRRWLRRLGWACAGYALTGLVVWFVALVRHPGAFGPVEWLMALAWYVMAWPVYLAQMLGS